MQQCDRLGRVAAGGEQQLPVEAADADLAQLVTVNLSCDLLGTAHLGDRVDVEVVPTASAAAWPLAGRRSAPATGRSPRPAPCSSRGDPLTEVSDCRSCLPGEESAPRSDRVRSPPPGIYAPAAPHRHPDTAGVLRRGTATRSRAPPRLCGRRHTHRSPGLGHVCKLEDANAFNETLRARLQLRHHADAPIQVISKRRHAALA